VNKLTIIIIIIIIVAGTIFFTAQNTSSPGPLDSFAQCLKDKGAVFYGAFWCPHCQNQKKMFGHSARLLPYVECSTADGQKQLPICTEKKITGYPTWTFTDGLTTPSSVVAASGDSGTVTAVTSNGTARTY